MTLDIRPALSASAPDSIDALREMLGSLEAQLVALYEEKEEWSARPGEPDETLTALYEDKQRLSARTIAELRASVDSFSAQLAEFYQEREQQDTGAHTGNSEELQTSLQSFEAQLDALYAERADATDEHAEALEMVASLASQVASLLEERDDLAAQIIRAVQELQATKKRAREMVNVVLEQSFA